jgi:hypothetical protein
MNQQMFIIIFFLFLFSHLLIILMILYILYFLSYHVLQHTSLLGLQSDLLDHLFFEHYYSVYLCDNLNEQLEQIPLDHETIISYLD